jgi:hypothetical protein
MDKTLTLAASVPRVFARAGPITNQSYRIASSSSYAAACALPRGRRPITGGVDQSDRLAGEEGNHDKGSPSALPTRQIGQHRLATAGFQVKKSARFSSHLYQTAYLKGFRSGASSCEIVRSKPRTTTLSAGTRWRTQTRIGAGRAPSRAFGSKAVRPNDTLRHPISMAS